MVLYSALLIALKRDLRVFYRRNVGGGGGGLGGYAVRVFFFFLRGSNISAYNAKSSVSVISHGEKPPQRQKETVLYGHSDCKDKDKETTKQLRILLSLTNVKSTVSVISHGKKGAAKKKKRRKKERRIPSFMDTTTARTRTKKQLNCNVYL